MRVVAAILILLASTGVGRGHDAPTGWRFDSWCCNGSGKDGDCQQIPWSSVKPISGGVRVDLAPGDHPLVTKPHTYSMEQGKVRFSPDGLPYACLYPTEATLRCLYLPPQGM